MDKESQRRLTAVEASHGISPYCLPVINNFVTPVPPATKRKERGLKVTPSGVLRGRRLRPTTASTGADVNEVLKTHRVLPGNNLFHNKLRSCGLFGLIRHDCKKIQELICVCTLYLIVHKPCLGAGILNILYSPSQIIN